MRKSLKSQVKRADRVRSQEARYDFLDSQDSPGSYIAPEGLEPVVLRTPEHRLIAAILLRACKDYASEMGGGLRRGASPWFQSRDDREFGFEYCCRELGLNSSRYREYLRLNWIKFLEEFWMSRA